MPLSHDSKPRKKDRRAKAQYMLALPKKPSRRSIKRRLLQQSAAQYARAQIQLEKTFRALGIRWRDIERAVNGNWSLLTKKEWLDGFFAARGIAIPEMKEAA